jgi:hypothetical protein
MSLGGPLLVNDHTIGTWSARRTARLYDPAKPVRYAAEATLDKRTWCGEIWHVPDDGPFALAIAVMTAANAAIGSPRPAAV